MKIVVISPNVQHLQDISKSLSEHQVILIEGGKSKMRVIAEMESPDVMLVEGFCRDTDELSQVEQIVSAYPHCSLILLSPTQSPTFLLNAMRAGVREVLPSPINANLLAEALVRITTKKNVSKQKFSSQILAFIPCKGGSGASFIATNFSYQLSLSRSVLLIDLNLQFGDALAYLHEAKPVSTIADLARDIDRLDASLLTSSCVKISPTFDLLAAPLDPSQAPEIKSEHLEAILDLAVSRYDFIVLDLARTLDPLSIKALDHADRIYPVLQAGLPYLQNAVRLLTSFRLLGYDEKKIAWILNRYTKGDDIRIEDVRRTLSSQQVCTISNDYESVTKAINHGEPLINRAKTNDVVRDIAELVQSVSPTVEENRSFLQRLLKRA